GQSVADYIVANDNNALFSVQPDVGNDGTLTFTPASNAHGEATVSVAIRDDGGVANGGVDTSEPQSFTITVNDPPTISGIPDQVIDENTSTGALAFTVGDAESAASALTVEGGSSDETLVPDANIELGGSGAQRTFEVTPAQNETGSATLTLKVEDGDGGEDTDTFVLTVNEVEDPAATRLTLKAKPASVKKGKSVTLSGRLSEVNGQAVAGERVVVQRKIGRAPYKNFRTLTTGANGAFSLKFKPARTAFYKVIFGGSEADGLEASSSPAKKVVAKAVKKKKKR
ncbi:MAG: Ig-like domain-containing protein, partial [Rubrobacteraceae bacterium]